MSQAETVCEDDPARDAYNEAVHIFNASLTNDSQKRFWLADKSDIFQVQEAVVAAKKTYETRSHACKARQWLTKLSTRIMFYSPVLNMLAQHHPEYVALVWGIIKFFLIGLLNHEELISKLAEALSRIAEVLPNIDVKVSLYRSPEMFRAVTAVYVSIIKLLQRGAGWYSEGKLKHFVSSVVRPYELRFRDLVEEIARSSRVVDQAAFTASQLELREMHTEHTELCKTVLDLKKYIAETQALNYRGFLDSSRRICEIQFSQVLSFTSDTPLISPEDALRFCQFRSRRRRQRLNSNVSPHWLSPKLHGWASTERSSLLLVKGSALHRHDTKDFATDIVSLLRSIGVPVVWILGAPAGSESPSKSPKDVLKQLIFQILQINMTLLNTQSTSLSAARFQAARTEQDWFDILASVVVGLPQLFLVVDAGLLEHELNGDVKWPDAFNNMLSGLMKACPDTVVKVILLSYGANPFLDSSSVDNLEDATVHINGQKRQSSSWPRQRAVRGLGSSSRRPFSSILRPVIYVKPQAKAEFGQV